MFIIYRSSNAIESIGCDLLNGICHVTFKNGYEYSYNGVSRRAMLNLKLNKNISLGFWVNDNLTNCDFSGTVFKYV